MEITDSLTVELRAEEGAGATPDVAVCVEDSVAEELERQRRGQIYWCGDKIVRYFRKGDAYFRRGDVNGETSGFRKRKMEWGGTISQAPWNSWPLPKSLNCVARRALMFSGSIVIIGVTPGARNCHYLQSSNGAVYLKCVAFNLFSVLPHQIEIGVVSIVLWSEGFSNTIPRIEDWNECSETRATRDCTGSNVPEYLRWEYRCRREDRTELVSVSLPTLTTWTYTQASKQHTIQQKGQQRTPAPESSTSSQESSRRINPILSLDYLWVCL